MRARANYSGRATEKGFSCGFELPTYFVGEMAR
jgi:hypothetical protein